MAKIILKAKSTHSRCFICNRKGKKLSRIKPISVAYALSRFNIVIKSHARCCGSHLDKRGLIKYQEFFKIESLHSQTITPETQLLLELSSSRSSKTIPPIDRFRNMESVDDNFCLKITGWKKSKFLEFNQYITTVNDT